MQDVTVRPGSERLFGDANNRPKFCTHKPKAYIRMRGIMLRNKYHDVVAATYTGNLSCVRSLACNLGQIPRRIDLT